MSFGRVDVDSRCCFSRCLFCADNNQGSCKRSQKPLITQRLQDLHQQDEINEFWQQSGMPKSLSILLLTFCRLHKVLRTYFSWRLLQFQPSLVEISMGSPQTSNGDVNLRAYIVIRNRVEQDTVPHRFVHGSTVLFPESLFGKQRDDTLYWFSNSFSLWSMILRLGECAWTNFGTRRGQKDLILSLRLWEWELTAMLL